MWSRILVTMYSYEYMKDSIKARDNRIDWFFEFEMLETIHDEKILHCKMPRSNLIDIFILIFDSCIQSSFTNSIDLDQLLETFVQKASTAAFVQEWYSYEADVINLSWLLFKIITSWLEMWNETVLSSAKDITSNWSLYCN